MTPAALVLIAALALPASADTPDESAAQRTLVGNFMSGFQDRVKPLRAVFTPVDQGEWRVIFYFEFNGRNHQYTGTASGSLNEGELSGTVKNEGGNRTFTFAGEFDDKGVFNGRHAEVGRRGERDTGTLTLGQARRRSG